MKLEEIPKIEKFFKLLGDNCGQSGISSYDVISSLGIDNIQAKVIDKYFRCVGLLTNRNLFIKTLPFSFSSHNLDPIYTKDLPRESFSNILKEIELVNQELFKNKVNLINDIQKFAIDNNDIVHGFIDNNDNYIPISEEPINKLHDKTGFDKVLYNYHSEIDNILYSKGNPDPPVDDPLQEEINKFSYKNNSYIQLKNDISNYLKNNTSLKNQIHELRLNNAIPIQDKRRLLLNFFEHFMNDFVSVKSNPKNVINSCYSLNAKKCKRKHGCEYRSPFSKDYDLDGIKHNLDHGRCSMILSGDLLKKYTTFIVDEILLNNNGKELINRGVVTYNYINKDNLSTITLSEL